MFHDINLFSTVVFAKASKTSLSTVLLNKPLKAEEIMLERSQTLLDHFSIHTFLYLAYCKDKEVNSYIQNIHLRRISMRCKIVETKIQILRNAKGFKRNLNMLIE